MGIDRDKRSLQALASPRYWALADPIVQWPRTPPFHGGNTGSNPVRVAAGYTRRNRAKCNFALAVSDTFRTVFAHLTMISAKRHRFPLVVKRGSSAVKIYRDRKISGTYYRVTFH